jgi:hypothetical protein
MDRSNKHGPRVDDELAHETESLTRGAPIESRVEESREQEGPGEEDFDTDARSGPPGALGADEVEARRELSRHLRPSVFPADREELVAEAEGRNAPASVSAALSRLPPGFQFATLGEVWAALADPDVANADELRDRARHDPLSEPDA